MRHNPSSFKNSVLAGHIYSPIIIGPSLRWFPIVLRLHACLAQELIKYSNLHMLKGKHQCFSIFYDVNIDTKIKSDREILHVSFGEIL